MFQTFLTQKHQISFKEQCDRHGNYQYNKDKYFDSAALSNILHGFKKFCYLFALINPIDYFSLSEEWILSNNDQ